MRKIAAVLAAVLLLAGCSSSAFDSAPEDSSDPCDAACLSYASDAAEPGADVDTGGDTEGDVDADVSGDPNLPATCAAWLRQGQMPHIEGATGYLLDHDVLIDGTQGVDLAHLITIACRSYGASETPTHIADVTLATEQSGNG